MKQSVEVIHILSRNVYANPSKVFDEMLEVQEILDCADDITKYYDDLITTSMYYQLLGEGEHTVTLRRLLLTNMILKKKVWLALNSVNILEGVSFLCKFCLLLGICRT